MSHEPIDEEEFSEEERAEAEALVAALERGSARDALPEDALETAAMLRFSADEGQLAPERLDAIFETVMSEAKVVRPERARVAWWRWLVPAGLVSAGALAIALVALPTRPSALPPVPSGVLAAQAEAASAGDASSLDAAMRSYRGAVFAALEDRYAR